MKASARARATWCTQAYVDPSEHRMSQAGTGTPGGDQSSAPYEIVQPTVARLVTGASEHDLLLAVAVLVAIWSAVRLYALACRC